MNEEPIEDIRQIMYYIYDFDNKKGVTSVVNEGSELHKILIESEK